MATEVQPSPPAWSTPPRWRRVVAPLATIGTLAAATLALHLRDPHVQHSWGFCPLFAMTGLYCPGCGGLRATNDLSIADLLGAMQSNLLFVLFVPVIVWALLGWTRARWQGRTYDPPVLGSERFAYLTLGLLLVFFVLRNLPGFDWLNP